MRVIRLIVAALLTGSAAAAQATTVIIFVEPMTLDRHMKVYDTPGPDRVLMCMAPPSTSGCTELPLRKQR
jgi:hypothetical protein